MQWALGTLEAGAQGVIRTIVTFKNADPKQLKETIDRISQDIKATILFSGYPGKSFSGLAFDLGDAGELDQGPNGADGVDSTKTGEPCGDQFFAGNVRTFGQLQLSV